MEEIWRDIPNYEGIYQISNLGVVRSLKFGKVKLLKPNKVGKGYLGNMLLLDKNKSRKYIHRLVAEVFLNKPDGNEILIVDHIDGNKMNNRVDNLQWLSYRDNFLKGNGVNSEKELGVFETFGRYKSNVARIYINGKCISLGHHKTDIQYLGRLYKKALELLHLFNGSHSDFIKLVKSNVEM